CVIALRTSVHGPRWRSHSPCSLLCPCLLSPLPPPPPPRLFPYTTLFRSQSDQISVSLPDLYNQFPQHSHRFLCHARIVISPQWGERKSTRLNSSHVSMSYAVFGLKNETTNYTLYNNSNLS